MAGEEHLDGLDPEERELFRDAVADVEPLQTDRTIPESSPPPAEARQTKAEAEQARLDLASGAADPPTPETGEEVFWCRNGVQRRLGRRLRTGQLPVEAAIDLHGLRVEEARVTLGRFLHQALGRGRRCVRVVHGKGLRSPGGQGVLRQRVHEWLALRDEVLAFASCLPRDGGEGAVYVLLRKRG